MKTLLVLAKSSSVPEAIRAALNPADYRVIHHREVWEAEPLFSRAMFDACFLDADMVDVRPIRVLEQLRRGRLQCPIFVYASARQWEWEEEAYLLGVEHIFSKPVRAPLLTSFLDRCWRKPSQDPVASGEESVESEGKAPAAVWGSARTLEVLRDFSQILTHSLQTDSLLKQFLSLLREVINVNRAAIFLRHPLSIMGDATGRTSERRLQAACSLGLSTNLLEHFALSLDGGIGGHAYRQGRILKSGLGDAKRDLEIQKEFELLGVQVAIPILDREALVGVAVFDGRLTGEMFANEELTLIFHLLEGLGLAIKNTWLHDEMSSNHQMMADVLDQLANGCVVVAKDLAILHANEAARAFFCPREKVDGRFNFGDLPQALASKVYEALQNGAVMPPFKYQSPAAGDRIYRIVITPFKRTNAHTPNAVMLLIEDITQHERTQQLEIETANLRLVKSMADRLAHEIGNSLVPIFTYQQLVAEENEDPEVSTSIENAMTEGLRRISRLTSQMRYLARDSIKAAEVVSINRLIHEAFEEAQASRPRKPEQLEYENGVISATLQGDFPGLKHALSEVMLNALQSAPMDAPVKVRTHAETDRNGHRWLQIEVRDAGTGFSAETAQRAAEPFYSRRTVGLGLGLTVSRKIIETHKGKLEIIPPQGEKHSLVRISLPLDSYASAAGKNNSSDTD